MGIFDDIFSDEDFEIKDEEELVDDSPEQGEPGDPGDPETWGTPKGDWDTGKQQDLWNTDEPWTCDDDCGVCKDDCQGEDEVLDDWF
jgi:hypothetical protein